MFFNATGLVSDAHLRNDTCSMLSQLQVLSNAFQQLSIGHPGPQASLVHMKLATTTEDIERATRSPSRDSHPSEVELRYENPSLSPAKPFPKSCNYASLSGCRCSCHRTSAFTTPWAMQYTFGALTVKLQGIPYIAPRCDEATCGKGGHSSLGFSYRFPPWLLNRAIHSLLNHSRVRGPQLNLTCTRIVHRDSAIFVFASEGNITGIQNLFRKGSASLLDVSHDSGLTALHYAVMCGHTELCDFLLKQGASREIQDFGSETSVGCAYSLICIRDVDDWSKQRIQCLFDEDLWLEQQQFTILHKVILGLDKTGRTLADELSVTTREINLPDSTGRTPISWAAELGNQEAVSDLLAFRADPNKDDKGGFSPVHYACLGGHPQILSLLLDNGSSPTKRDILKQTPLMRLGRDDPSLIDKLLARPDVQLNETDEDRWNALWFAAYSSQEKVLSHLLNLGADPNQTNLDGWNVLFSSIGWNRHASVRILLEKSSQSALNLAHCDHDGDDCLHFLAHFADPETASIFLEALQDGLLDLTALDTARVNNKGWTVRDLLARHESHDVRPILEKALAFIEEKKVGERGFLSSEEEEAASDESSVTSEELQYADALELLQHSEEIETEGL